MRLVRHHKSKSSLQLGFLLVLSFGLVSFLVTFHSHHDLHQHFGSTAEHLKEFGILPTNKTLVGVQTTIDKLQNELPRFNHQVQHDKLPQYHVVFSTSCEDQQNWESYVFFYHAFKVKQSGTVTRIASGCSEQEAENLRQFHEANIRRMSNQFHLHLTPDFSRGDDYIKTNKGRYKYMNKPYGLRHWLEETLGMNTVDHDPAVEDGIVILMDPDMILLRPIVHDYTNEDMIFVEQNPATKIVKHGFPIAQQDGYLNNKWMHLNATYITNGGNIDTLSDADGPKHYNTGPPYLATVRDMHRISVLWTEYAPRVYEIHPQLFAEMYGYIYATTQLGLPHTLIKSIVVSTTTTPNREGWPYVDRLSEDKVCDPPKSAALPIGLHYCKRYLLDKWFFSKYRLKKNYISCESPRLLSPPKDLATKGYTYSLQPPPTNHEGTWDPPRKEFNKKQAKREAFMLCALTAAVNEASTYFKKSACNKATVNWNSNYTVFNDPERY